MVKRIAAATLWIVLSSATVEAAPEAPFYFALAQAYTQEGAYREAVDAFQKAVELEPAEPYIRMEFAELLLRLGRVERASEHAGAARRLSPSHPDAVRLYAFVQRRLADEDPQAMGAARQAFVQLHQMAPEDAEASMMLAQIYLEEELVSEAVAVLEDTLELRPRSRMLISLLVETLDRQGQPDEAARHLEAFLQANPRYLRGRLALAELLGRKGEHRRAAEVLAGATGEGRETSEIRRDLALALYRSGQLVTARQEVEAWLVDEPDALPALLLAATLDSAQGDDRRAEGFLRHALEVDPASFRAVSLLSDLLERTGRGDEAQALLGSSAAELRESGKAGAAAQLLLRLIDQQVAGGDWAGVLSTAREVEVLLEPGVAVEVAMIRAQALGELGRRQEALAVLDSLRRDERVASRALAAAAELRFVDGDAATAIRDLERLGSGGELSDVLLAAQSLQRLELYGKSIPLLRRADAMSGGSTDVLFWLGAAYEREGRHAAAEREFRRLLAARPDFAPALNYLGYMWAERGVNLEEAIELVGRAVALEPENGAYVDSLGWAYFRLGRYEEARGHLERAAELVGDDAVVLEHLGDLYRAVGELEEARLSYEKALGLAEDNVDEVRRKLRDLGGAL